MKDEPRSDLLFSLFGSMTDEERERFKEEIEAPAMFARQAIAQAANLRACVGMADAVGSLINAAQQATTNNAVGSAAVATAAFEGLTAFRFEMSKIAPGILESLAIPHGVAEQAIQSLIRKEPEECQIQELNTIA